MYPFYGSHTINSSLSKNEREDIFSNSILVLSKCDKIRLGLERKIVQLIQLKSPQLKDFPYRYVVGVVNKIENEIDNDDIYNNDNNDNSIDADYFIYYIYLFTITNRGENGHKTTNTYSVEES